MIRWLIRLVLIAIAAAVTAFAALNSQWVDINLGFTTWHVQLPWVLLLCFMLGLLATLMIVLPMVVLRMRQRQVKCHKHVSNSVKDEVG